MNHTLTKAFGALLVVGWAIRKEQVRDPWGFQNASRYACSLAKRLAIRRAKLAGAEAVVLFEDDLILAPDLHERLEEIDLPDDWGIFFLGCKHIERPLPIARNLLRVTRATDNHAIVIRSQYFQTMIRALSGTGKGREGTIPYSDAQASLIQRYVPTYAAFPNLAWQDFSLSNNEGTDVTYYDPGGRQRSRREAIEGLEDEIEEKFGCVENARRSGRKTKRITGPELGSVLNGIRRQSLEEIAPSCFYLNRGRDELPRLEMEREFLKLLLVVKRVPVPCSSEGRKRGEREMKLLGHWMAIRKAKDEGAVAVMVFEDDLTLDDEFRKLIENSELPMGWEILVMEKIAARAGNVLHGWILTEKIGQIGAYIIHRKAFRKVMNEIARKIRFDKCSCEMVEVFECLTGHFSVHAWRGSLVRTKQGTSLNLMKWMAEFRETRMWSMSIRSLPPLGERKRFIGEFGVDVFADAFHHYMRTGKALGNE